MNLWIFQVQSIFYLPWGSCIHTYKDTLPRRTTTHLAIWTEVCFQILSRLNMCVTVTQTHFRIEQLHCPIYGRIGNFPSHDLMMKSLNNLLTSKVCHTLHISIHFCVKSLVNGLLWSFLIYTFHLTFPPWKQKKKCITISPQKYLELLFTHNICCTHKI